MGVAARAGDHVSTYTLRAAMPIDTLIVFGVLLISIATAVIAVLADE